MVNELVMKERIEGVVRVLESGHDKLAKQILLGIIDEIDREVEDFETDMQKEFVFSGS